LGQTVLISNYQEYYKLVDYFARFTKKRLGLILGINNLLEIFNEKYYRNLTGGILEAFGRLFSKDLKVFVYPYKESNSSEFITTEKIGGMVHPRFKPIYEYLVFNKRITDIPSFDPEILQIFSRDVLKKIRSGEPGWEKCLPAYVDNIIKEKGLFGYKEKKEKSKA
jgi:hypothetical protein